MKLLDSRLPVDKYSPGLFLGEAQFTGVYKLDDFIMSIANPVASQYLSKSFGAASVIMISSVRLASVLATISLFIRHPEGATNDSGLNMHFLYGKPIWQEEKGSNCCLDGA